MNFPLSGDNAYFLDLYARYRRDPSSVPQDWRLYLDGVDSVETRPAAGATPPSSLGEVLLGAFREHGYKQARLDPLGLTVTAPSRRLEAARSLAGSESLQIKIAGTEKRVAADLAANDLSALYCGTASLQASHVDEPAERDWLYETYETELTKEPDQAVLARSLECVLLADEFEKTLKTKWPTKKRFGSEGSETSMVLLREAFDAASKSGYREAVIGGMHRGRLASLATVFGKSLPTLIAEIKGADVTKGHSHFTGDVPYHNGLRTAVTIDNIAFEIRVLPHPSHLTVVAPVALGAARARREIRPDGKVLSLLLHSDAAFEGQGLVSELLQMDGLKGYTSGGAIHIVVNNQIGFTTLPEEGRSTPHPTDIGRAYGLPVFHVNGDDPVAAAAVMRVAIAWREHTGKGSLINLVCYRRNGHNELDEPRFTQPKTWLAIDKHPSLAVSHANYVRSKSPGAADAAEKARSEFAGSLADAFRSHGGSNAGGQEDETIVFPEMQHRESSDASTGIPKARLEQIAHSMTTLPADFDINPKIVSFYNARRESLLNGEGINMATAEALAFASLLSEGISVRLSGQDCVRGTFTQRHLAVHDQASGRTFVPTALAASGEAQFDAINSPLIEYGVLSFEYGMSLADPDRLVMWEAQFGDFLNGAQIVVDQFIMTAQAKWRMGSSLVVALPHGLEGQGPDHSSARIERILQSCVNDNIYLANPSTPANLFHLLRRQQRGPSRRPLFLIAPKALLRHKAAVSRVSDFTEGSRFMPVIETPSIKPCRRVIMCSGKIFYALAERAAVDGRDDVSLVRVEQIFPFPEAEIRALLDRNPKAELIWCQEEPRNQGAFNYAQSQISNLAANRRLHYAGRVPMAAAAGGSIDRHEIEQSALIDQALFGTY